MKASRALKIAHGHEPARAAMGRLYGPKLLVIWNGGVASKEGNATDLAELPDLLHASDLQKRGFTIEGHT